MDFSPENFGMGVGDTSIYRTIDGGFSWSAVYQSPTQYFSGLDVLDSLQVWATSYDSLYRSTDGGNTWNRHTINNVQYFPSFHKIKFTDPQHLWFSNQYGAWLSRDTAKTWTLIPVDGAFLAFDFADSLTGWVSIWGGMFKKMALTTDGGVSWELVDRPYASQPTDLLSYRDGKYFGGVFMFAAGFDGSLTKFRQGDSYVYDIPTYTGNTLHSFATYRNGNVLHLWVAGDGMILLHQTTVVTGIEDEMHGEASSYVLSQNYPNPFNPRTVISYRLPVAGEVKLVVYDMLGKTVATLVNELEGPGEKSVEWNASGIASGVYFYRLQASTLSRQAGGFVQTRKLLLLQ